MKFTEELLKRRPGNGTFLIQAIRLVFFGRKWSRAGLFWPKTAEKVSLCYQIIAYMKLCCYFSRFIGV